MAYRRSMKTALQGPLSPEEARCDSPGRGPAMSAQPVPGTPKRRANERQRLAMRVAAMMENADVNRYGGWMVALVVVAAAVLGTAPAKADDAETIMKDMVQAANEMADCLATVRDEASAQAAQPRLTSLGDRFRSFDARKKAIPPRSFDDDRRLLRQYGSALVAAQERMVKEAERLVPLGFWPAEKAAQSRAQFETIRAAVAAAQDAGPPPGPAPAPAGPTAPAPAGPTAPAPVGPTGPAPPSPGPAPPPSAPAPAPSPVPSAPGTLVPKSQGGGQTEWYSMFFGLLMLAIIAACAGSLYPEGMWSNAVRLVNVVFAALLATNFWEPLARWAEGMAPTFTFFWDFLCLWGLFCVFLIVFRVPTDMLSRVKVRFLKIADRIGSAFFGLWIGWVLVAFTMFTLHTAPLAERFMGGAFGPGEDNFLWMAPDLQWAAFVQRMSGGPFSRGLDEAEMAKYPKTDKEQEKDTAVFDRDGDFVPKYAARRRLLETYLKEKGTPRVSESDQQAWAR